MNWQNEIPDRWALKRLRFVADINPSKGEVSNIDRETEVSFVPMEGVGDDGTLNLDRTRPLRDVENGYTYFREGDVTIAKITPCFENGKGAIMRGLVGGFGFGTTELTVARPNPSETTAEFLYWLLTSVQFRGPAEGAMYGAGGQKRVPDNFVRNFLAAFPPLPEQAAIAAFLDRETGKIDALVEEQRLLIELLKEKRQAVISHAVTKGLTPDTPMKDTGIKWLGEVPKHWGVIPLRALFRFVKRQNGDDLEVLSVYREYGVIPKASRDDNNNKTPEDLSSYQTVYPGDLVVNKMKSWQGSLGISRKEGITSPDYAVFQSRHEGEPEYFNWLLRCSLLPDVYRSISNGIRPDQWRLEPDRFKELKIPFPPLVEQRQIDERLKTVVDDFVALSEQAEVAITLLLERRAALISAAVTGKLDVRGLVETREAAE